MQQEKINQWLIEDKAYLKLNISIGNLSQFVSGDFEVKEENNLKEISQSINFLYKNSQRMEQN